MKQHTVKTLIESLENLDKNDYDVVFEEKGGMYNTYISNAYTTKRNYILLSNSRNEKYSVGVLIEKLKTFNQDLKVSFYESGGVYDTIVSNVFQSHYDIKNQNNKITLKNS